MKHTHKQKIETLNEILKEYAKYFIYFNECKCLDLGLRFAILFKSSNGKTYQFLTRKIPRYQIDVVIARYRSKLSYEVDKMQHYELKRESTYRKAYIRNIPINLLNAKFF